MSRLDYTYQHLHISVHASRFTYTYQDPLVSTSSLITIDQLPFTQIDNHVLYRSSRTDIYTSRSSHIHHDLYIEVVIGLYEVLSVTLHNNRSLISKIQGASLTL